MGMEQLIPTLLSVDWLGVLGAITALLTAVIAIASFIPGDQPEKALQAVVDVLQRLSRK
jgi:hypothetical protein